MCKIQNKPRLNNRNGINILLLTGTGGEFHTKVLHSLIIVDIHTLGRKQYLLDPVYHLDLISTNIHTYISSKLYRLPNLTLNSHKIFHPTYILTLPYPTLHHLTILRGGGISILLFIQQLWDSVNQGNHLLLHFENEATIFSRWKIANCLN